MKVIKYVSVAREKKLARKRVGLYLSVSSILLHFVCGN